MGSAMTMWLGIAFLLIGIVATILQAWLWSFPMAPDPGGPDPNGKSTAPPFWTGVHRILGLLFVIIYVIMMVKMVPRLWEYQVELPARTVMHVVMGITIGMLLIAKIAIIRWFQHFGKALPMLGYGVLMCTVILSFLSLPFAIQAHGFGTLSFDDASMKKLHRELVNVNFAPGLPESVMSEEALSATEPDPNEQDAAKIQKLETKRKTLLANHLASQPALVKGRQVLMGACVKCHDMRTILAKPRPPQRWHDVVVRMAEKPTMGSPMTDADLSYVTAYLVAITPDIKRSNRRKSIKGRSRTAVVKSINEPPKAAPKKKADGVEEPASSVPTATAKDSPPETKSASAKKEEATAQVNAEDHRETFEEQCTSCHGMDEIHAHGADNAQGWQKVVEAMIEEMGAEISESDSRKIIQYLVQNHGR